MLNRVFGAGGRIFLVVLNMNTQFPSRQNTWNEFGNSFLSVLFHLMPRSLSHVSVVHVTCSNCSVDANDQMDTPFWLRVLSEFFFVFVWSADMFVHVIVALPRIAQRIAFILMQLWNESLMFGCEGLVSETPGWSPSQSFTCLMLTYAKVLTFAIEG